MTNEQVQLVKDLDSLKKKVQNTNDMDKIIYYIKQAIALATPVEPKLAYYSNIEGLVDYQGKANTINMLISEVQGLINNRYSDIESVHFQISASLVMLMNKFADGLHEIEQITKPLPQV